MKTYDSLIGLIGNTPLLRLKNIENKLGLCANVYAKLERGRVPRVHYRRFG